MIEAKFHVSFYVDIEKLPEILNRVLPVGIFEFHTEFVPLPTFRQNANGNDQFLALPPPESNKSKRRAKPIKAPRGQAAAIIRRCLSHMPEHTATAREFNRALTKGGLNPNQQGAIRTLIAAGEVKKVARGTYTLVKG